MSTAPIDVRSSAFTDDSSTAFGMGHSATSVRRFTRASFTEHAITRAPIKDAQLAVMPEPGNDCREDLVGKSPEQMAEIIARDEAASDARVDVAQLMQEVPGGRAPGSHSSSGRRHSKPKPPPDFTSQPIVDLNADGPREFRPHGVSGRVSTQARQGLMMQAVSIGDMLDVLGKTLAVGVPWREIEYALREMAARQSVA